MIKAGLRMLIITGIAVAVCVILLFAVLLRYGALWLQAYMSGAPVRFLDLIAMSLRQAKPGLIVTVRIMASQAGLDFRGRTGISTSRLEAHFLAGGNVMQVICAIIAANRADIALDFDRAAAIDLAGRDVLDAVRTSVYPKVIDCPSPGRNGKSSLSAIAKDGIELRVLARVTVRTNLDQLIGGATEETIIARVGEGIVTSIGSAKTHMDVMKMPDQISKDVLNRGLDANTAFEVVSIDIADIEIGQNVGARLQSDQADADSRVARAKAEQRRTQAIALQGEMKAKIAGNRASLILAESEVPKAMSIALREGNIDSSFSPLGLDEFFDRASW